VRDDHLEANRRRWDELVPVHVGSAFYDVEGFKAGTNRFLPPWILSELGSVQGRDLVHLQCHFGMDTLSLARQGARVTGLDFSRPAVEAARRLAGEIGVDAEFVQADVHDAVAALDGRQFDIVFTGLGALCWLPDIRTWANVVAPLVRPGGFLYLVEFHPVMWTFAWGEEHVCANYLERAEPYVDEEPGDYAVSDVKLDAPVSYEWNHGLGEIITALIDAGLRLRFLHERVESVYNQTGFLVEREPGTWVMPEGELPMLFSLRADRLAGSGDRLADSGDRPAGSGDRRSARGSRRAPGSGTGTRHRP